MNDLRSMLHSLVDDVPVGAPPTEAMITARTPRRWAVPVAAAAAVLAVIGGVAAVQLAGDGERRQEPAPAPTPTGLGAWQELPPMPLSPRSDVLAAYVDGQVVVVGGSDARTRGGPFTLPHLRDGAAYDPETQEWRPIATAPKVFLRQAYPHVVVGDQVVVPIQAGPQWLIYDVSDDAWRTVPAPEGGTQQPTMAVDGDRVFVLGQHVNPADDPALPIRVLDLGADAWSTLPLSEQRPMLSDRTLLFTDAGLVVMGGDLVPQRKEAWRRTRAEVWDGERWTRSVSPDNVRGSGWHWTGDRVITMYRSTQRSYRQGPLSGWIPAAFDPATGEWGRIPWPPRESPKPLGGHVGLGPRTLTYSGLYDDRTGETIPVDAVPGGWYAGADSGVVMTEQAILVLGGDRPVLTPVTSAPRRVYEVELTNRAWIRTLPD